MSVRGVLLRDVLDLPDVPGLLRRVLQGRRLHVHRGRAAPLQGLQDRGCLLQGETAASVRVPIEASPRLTQTTHPPARSCAMESSRLSSQSAAASSQRPSAVSMRASPSRRTRRCRARSPLPASSAARAWSVCASSTTRKTLRRRRRRRPSEEGEGGTDGESEKEGTRTGDESYCTDSMSIYLCMLHLKRNLAFVVRRAGGLGCVDCGFW